MAKMNKIMPPRNTTIRGQDHLLAYITPDEASLLKARGGSGEAGPMGIPAYADTGGPAGADDTAEEGGGFSDADAGQGFGFGGSTGGFADALGGLMGYSPLVGIVDTIGGFLDNTVGLEAHGPGAGGGTEGDGPDFSAISRFYGGGGGGGVSPSSNSCPEGYIYDEQLGACRLNTRPDMVVPTSESLLQSAPSGGYARMGLLDVAPTGLDDFSERYGISGYASPSAFEEQNLAFRRQGATYPEFFKNPPLLPGYTNLETGAVVPPSGIPVGGMPSPVAPSPVAPSPVAPSPVAPSPVMPPSNYGRIDSLYTNEGNLSPTGEFIGTIVGLGIDDPLIQRAQDVLGPSGGSPWARALNIAAQLPTPSLGFATRGQYLESLGSIGQRLGVTGIKIQDDTGRTIGYQGFERPEGDG